MHTSKSGNVLMILLVVLFTGGLLAQKPFNKRHAEVIPDVVEETYRMDKMRVSKATGAPIALYKVNYPVKAASPEAMARQYLSENAALLKITDGLNELVHTHTRKTPAGLRVRFLQHIAGYPVYNGDIAVSLNHSREVVFVMNSYKPLAALKDAKPKISIDAAESIALKRLDIKGAIRYQAKETVVYYNEGSTRLAHKVTVVPSEDTFGTWEVLVDAQTGDIFRLEDKNLYGSHRDGNHSVEEGTANVFDPDPLSHAGAQYQAGGQFGDNNDGDTDSLTAHTVQVTLLDITFDGTMYHLEGPYANIEDVEGPFNGEFSRSDNQWLFTRSADAFEAANVYYHLDKSMRYINETLGFSLMPFQYTTGVEADPSGWNGADNSSYSPATGELSFGEGGVDDAEDPDVILHELGHGLHDWLTNGSLSQVNGLSEGCGDYWAQSYVRSLGLWDASDPEYNWVFHWDGHNEFWNGRVTDVTATYPGGLVGQIHTDGQMWATTLMLIYDDIGREATDLNFLEALSMTNSATSQEDAAQAFIQADIDNYGGANLDAIVGHFQARGYNVTVPGPAITHTPLVDTEDLNGPYTVSATISSGSTLTDVQLVYGDALTDTVDMVLANGAYTADIPGTGTAATYNYYILAIDDLDLATTSPSGAPGNFYSFATGADTEAPVVTHTELNDQAFLTWPATVTATVTDNISLSSVTVDYDINSGSVTGSFSLSNTSGDVWSGQFDVDTTVVAVDDVITYQIIATDASSSANQTVSPASGSYSFTIIDVRGVVLVLDDDSQGKTEVTDEKGTYVRDLTKHPFGKTATTISTALTDIGFLATVEDAATSDPATWGNYDLLISSSGFNVDPVADAAYRTALQDWVADPSNKLIVEGGEVGYDAVDAPGYPDFAAQVLHSDDWVADDAGDLNVVTAQASHPIVTSPHAIPSPLVVNYTGSNWATQDAMNAINGAYLIYENSDNANTAGVSVYDDNADPTSAQIVYFAFNYDDIDDGVAMANMLENTVEYLLTPEGGGNTPPAAFALLTPADGDTVVSNANITFEWETAVDSDPVTYTLTISEGATVVYTEAGIGATSFNYTGSDLALDTEYSWDVVASDGSSSTSSSNSFNFVTPTVVSIETGNTLPDEFALHQNYPNPFNPTTLIRYDLRENVQVTLRIYNLLGQEVRTLVNGFQPAGQQQVLWDGLDNKNNTVPSGIYIYRIEAGSFVNARKMVMLQ